MAQRISRRHLLIAAAGGTAAGLLFRFHAPPPAHAQAGTLPAPAVQPRPDVYVIAADLPDADGSPDRPIALARALRGEGGVGPVARLLLLETDYRLLGPIAVTVQDVAIGHIDGAPVTIALEGALVISGENVIWNNVTITGSAS